MAAGTRGPLDALIKALKRLPGVGEKTATRYAFYILNAPEGEIAGLHHAIRDVRETLKLCSVCRSHTDRDPCAICSDPKRDASRICVVETPLDLMAIEKSGRFRGVYHVLHGTLSPLDAVGPEDINIPALMKRLEEHGATELILALNPTVEAEATASYLREKTKSLKIPVTRIAYGIPVGGSLEYADPLTLARALDNRKEL
jgi:recombination protein RecR